MHHNLHTTGHTRVLKQRGIKPRPSHPLFRTPSRPHQRPPVGASQNAARGNTQGPKRTAVLTADAATLYTYLGSVDNLFLTSTGLAEGGVGTASPALAARAPPSEGPPPSQPLFPHGPMSQRVPSDRRRWGGSCVWGLSSSMYMWCSISSCLLHTEETVSASSPANRPHGRYNIYIKIRTSSLKNARPFVARAVATKEEANSCKQREHSMRVCSVCV